MRLRCRLGIHKWRLVHTRRGITDTTIYRRELYWCAYCVKPTHRYIVEDS